MPKGEFLNVCVNLLQKSIRSNQKNKKSLEPCKFYYSLLTKRLVSLKLHLLIINVLNENKAVIKQLYKDKMHSVNHLYRKRTFENYLDDISCCMY